jgi:hypothetical protein
LAGGLVPTTLTNLTGSGTIVDNSVMSFSYTEDVTSLEPQNLTGGSGQVSFTAEAANQADVSNNLHPSSKLLINNTMRLESSQFGAVEFIGTTLSITDKMVSVTGNTVQARLNVEKTAGPHGGSGATLWTAIISYCGLVGVVPTISAPLQVTLDAIPVNFIGWKGNVWEYLKMLCAAVSLSDTDNIGLEMYIDENDLVFRQAKTTVIDISEYVMEKTLSVTSVDSSQAQTISFYKTSYGVDQVVAEEDRSDLTAATKNVTIDDQMQVDPGETLVKRFSVNCSLESINQPQVVSAIIPLPFSGTVGQYVVVGSDDLPIEPTQWIAQGGSLTVSLTENPNEIELVIVAPPATELPTAADPAVVTLGPYKIGTESSGEEDYPALYITGTGVFFEKSSKTFGTGASPEFTSDDSSSEIDNPFFNTKFNLSTRGVAAAQAVCGPQIELSMTVADGVQFGTTVGSLFFDDNNKYRIESIAFSTDSASITASACASFTDFESIWSGQNFNAFSTVAGTDSVNGNQALKFNEFTVIPLMES